MSYTTLFVVENDGEVVPVKEFGNSWGSGAMVWTALCEKYNIRDEFGYTSTEAWATMWKKDREGTIKLKDFERNVLFSTYDDAIVAFKDFAKFIDSLRKFEAEHKKQKQVCHMNAIADEIEKLKDDCIGICFQQTSVAEDPWSIYDEDTDDTIPYNTNTGTKHWFVDIK